MGLLIFALVLILSVAFALALLFRPEGLSSVWASVRALPTAVQVIVWVIFLPWMASLWIWHSPWPAWLRLPLVVVLVVGTPVAFFPRQR